jgi:hypothetical protein
VYAARELSEAESGAFVADLAAAEAQSTGRAEAAAAVWERVERGLRLLGATAIEDCLQRGVPETIHALLQADVRVWVLTGDKRDTAVNIATRCRLLTSEMTRLDLLVTGACVCASMRACFNPSLCGRGRQRQDGRVLARSGRGPGRDRRRGRRQGMPGGLRPSGPV